jgi:hypothetical protein
MRNIMIAAAVAFGLSAFGASAQTSGAAAGTATGQDQQNSDQKLNDTSVAPNHDLKADAKHDYGTRQNGPNSAADDRRDDKGAPGASDGPAASIGSKTKSDKHHKSSKSGLENAPKDDLGNNK